LKKEGFRSEKLLDNLQLVAERIGHEDLPVTVKEIYVFGSILRKTKPGDIDVVAIYNMNDIQRQSWSNFYENLGKALREFDRFDQIIPFSEIVTNNSEYFFKKGIDPTWAECFSWSSFQSFGWNPLAIDWRVVVGRKLTKGIKGVHIQFADSLSYFENLERFLLAWSQEKSDIRANLMSPEPRLRVLAAENELLRKELKDVTERLEVFMTLYANMRGLAEELTNVFKQNVYGHTFDDVLTLRTILFIPKRRVKEGRIREILKEHGLPVDKIEKVAQRTYHIKKI
jgi:hypothetical protein